MYLGRYEGVVFTEEEARDAVELLHQLLSSPHSENVQDEVRKFLNELPINRALNDVAQEMCEGHGTLDSYPGMLERAKVKLRTAPEDYQRSIYPVPASEGPEVLAACGCGPSVLRRHLKSGQVWCLHGEWKTSQINDYADRKAQALMQKGVTP